MSNNPVKSAESNPGDTPSPGFFKRYRIPLTLGVIALCLYAGSILYILYGRGQVA